MTDDPQAWFDAEGARGEGDASRYHAPVKRGLVVAVNTDGTVSACVLGGRGLGPKLDRLRPTPGDAALSVDDEVLLLFERAGDSPNVIALGGGGLLGAFQSWTDYGRSGIETD